MAQQLAQLLSVPERKLVSVSSTATSQIGRAGLVEELRRIPGAPDPVLLETLPKGVAFHHAGLAFHLCRLPLGLPFTAFRLCLFVVDFVKTLPY